MNVPCPKHIKHETNDFVLVNSGYTWDAYNIYHIFASIGNPIFICDSFVNVQGVMIPLQLSKFLDAPDTNMMK